ncbi:hypothetical protein L1987_32243 [Smallanthus sonchifolius]|uniref:Uncharacterized protein n=1 Tax=Smallanthus sonchifolius TaxID=185202 RepID=A0ACB9I8Q4_9ASTR|nr:hypothetical protein L1987_32243 [Smallanthus sonchifolius]
MAHATRKSGLKNEKRNRSLSPPIKSKSFNPVSPLRSLGDNTGKDRYNKAACFSIQIHPSSFPSSSAVLHPTGKFDDNIMG